MEVLEALPAAAILEPVGPRKRLGPRIGPRHYRTRASSQWRYDAAAVQEAGHQRVAGGASEVINAPAIGRRDKLGACRGWDTVTGLMQNRVSAEDGAPDCSWLLGEHRRLMGRPLFSQQANPSQRGETICIFSNEARQGVPSDGVGCDRAGLGYHGEPGNAWQRDLRECGKAV